MLKKGGNLVFNEWINFLNGTTCPSHLSVNSWSSKTLSRPFLCLPSVHWVFVERVTACSVPGATGSSSHHHHPTTPPTSEASLEPRSSSLPRELPKASAKIILRFHFGRGRLLVDDQSTLSSGQWQALPVWGGKEPDNFLLAGLLSTAADADQVLAQPFRSDAWQLDSLYVEGKWGTAPNWPGFYCAPCKSPGSWCE